MLKPSSAVSDGKKPCRQTSAHDRCQACQDLHASRSDDTRRMARRTPPEVLAKIRALLVNRKKTRGEVRDLLMEDGIIVSPSTIDKVAYALAEQGLLDTTSRKARAGVRLGRPKGTTGTKWSANREKIVALRMAYPLMTPAEMAEQLGITADAVRKILREFKEAAATAIVKKHT